MTINLWKQVKVKQNSVLWQNEVLAQILDSCITLCKNNFKEIFVFLKLLSVTFVASFVGHPVDLQAYLYTHELIYTRQQTHILNVTLAFLMTCVKWLKIEHSNGSKICSSRQAH